MGDNGGLIVLSSEGSTDRWNMFEEPRADSFRNDVRMLSRSLFPTHSGMSDTAEHFQLCARQVYEATFVAMRRLADEEGAEPTNRDFVNFVTGKGKEGVYELLSDYDDLGGFAALISPEGRRHADSVFSTVFTSANEVFHDDFADRGDFSIRDYMKNPDGRTLLLDMKSEVEAPIFRLLVDWAIYHALVDDDRRKFFLLDEFQQIPHLQNLQKLVNTGRSYKAESLCGLQSIAQLQSEYSPVTAEGILAGFPQIVSHRSSDETTTGFIRSRIGREQTGRKFEPWEDARRFGGDQEVVRETYPISEQEVQQSMPGDAFSIGESKWAGGFRVRRLRDCRGYLDRFYAGGGDAAGYLLPVAGKAYLVKFSEGGRDVEEVDHLRYRRDYSILVVGGTGSGKTTTLKVFAYQQAVNPDEPRVVFDYKEDWKKFYAGELS